MSHLATNPAHASEPISAEKFRFSVQQWVARPLAALRELPRFTLARRTAGEALDVQQVLDAYGTPMLVQSPEVQEQDRISAEFAALAAAGDWLEALSRLRALDQSREATLGGKRLWELACAGLRQSLTDAMDRNDWSDAALELARLAVMQEAHPEDYCAAAIAARANIDFAWGLQATQIGASHRAESLARYSAIAESLLDDFDPIAEMSSLLALTRYLLIRGFDDGGDYAADWYADMVDLDPTNPLSHATHAFHRLPHWFGKAESFADEAAEAAKATSTEMGATAYALFFTEAMAHKPELLSTMDSDDFAQALLDYQAQTTCQYRANIAAAALQRAYDTLRRMKTKPARLEPLVKAMRELLQQKTTEVYLDLWGSEAELASALQLVFDVKLKQADADRAA